MTERPQYPQQPWQYAVPVVAAVLAFTGAMAGLKQSRPLLQREYLGTYAALSVNLPRSEAQPVIINAGGKLATLADGGVLHRETRAVKDPAAFRSWLEANIYEGKPIWWFLWLPELAALLAFVPLLLWAIKSTQNAARDSWDGKVLRGASLISHRAWNRLIPRKQKGFYIETE
ncbi:MAG: hypothetical protein ACJ73N_05675 [Bryobacteraceae bacterium]